MMNPQLLLRRSVLCSAIAGLLAGGAYAQSTDPTPQQQTSSATRKTFARDKQDLAKDRADATLISTMSIQDRRDLNKDRVDRNKVSATHKDKLDCARITRNMASTALRPSRPQGLAHRSCRTANKDQRDINKDRRDLTADPRIANQDQRDINKDKRDLRKDRKTCATTANGR